jgi:undecaprenyl diphosphate synthase
MTRLACHNSSDESRRAAVQTSAERGIKILTLFAFSSENWRRPEDEVSPLLELLFTTLGLEVQRLHKNNVRLRIIGERSAFSAKLQKRIADAETQTRDNTGLNLVIAVNYGGRWDITQAAQQLAESVNRGELSPGQITPERFQACLSLGDLPEPDLFIRTGGEQRISNFLLWQLAYTELYFTDILWPDFDAKALDSALAAYCQRQRRFGRTGDQVEQEKSSA